ncbi:Mas-related G-protein coupled receptor member G [Galemys pyrenaicus]|uniref:Mas-related G-protein coupled receptor member G n=1 Tax=Galemys pyrenaicus TaxID=202257 RepID=A0A8J6AKL4_GALPY|nr:Mas-related G-protein coupled receptor member G [Galemys pyrenaicus]
MSGLWSTFTSVTLYLTLAASLGGLVGNGLVLWHLGLHIRKGPFSVYLLHLAGADLLFLGCQLGFSAVQAARSAPAALHLPVAVLCFSAGLWLLAAFSAERCLSALLPACHQRCRPRHTSALVCGLGWALTLPAVLLPAHACGLLGSSTRLLTCLRYHAASVAWLLSLSCVTCVAGLVLFVWVTCCSQRPRPQFYGIALGAALLLLVCGLPFVLYWSLRLLLDLLLPPFLPLATLLACVHCSAKPLLYFAVGRQPGRREPLRAVFQRALGEGALPGGGVPALPMGAV